MLLWLSHKMSLRKTELTDLCVGLTTSGAHRSMLKATTIGLGGAASLTLGAATLILTPAVAGGA